MSSILKSVTLDRKSDSERSMHIYLENIPGELQPHQIWNDGALGAFLKRSPQQHQEEQDD